MSPKSLSQNRGFSDKLPRVSNEESTPNPAPSETSEGTENHENEPNALPSDDDFGDLNSFHLPNPKLKELIHSPDTPSRYLTWLALSFAGLAVICFGLLIGRYIQYRNTHRDVEAEKAEEARLYGGWLSKQLAFNRARPGEEPIFMQALGEFRVTWPGSELRVSMSAQCTNEETCNELKARPEQVHDLLLPVLQASNPEDILNPNRKLELRRLISEKLNTLKFSGKVIMVDFLNLTVEPGPGLEAVEPEKTSETKAENQLEKK